MSLSGIFPIDKWSFNTQSILTTLTEDQYHYLITRQGAQKYQKGEIIFKEGMVPSGIYFIHQGKVKKYKKGSAAKEQIIYVANKGELIGYHAILSEERYPDSAATLEESTLTFIPKEDFLRVLQDSPAFARKLLTSLSHEYSVLANSISVVSQSTSAERLAIALILIREKSKAETLPGEEPVINISRNDLAGMAGIAKENVIRLLKEFKSEQIIRTEGRKIWVQDIIKLVNRSNYK
ncbi:Crp/Fnr family transcriptional regulator [Pedobacter ginsengisoli]|uniref:Crp/Fnr family transcriptional regulator n=1 Tax=Pedobacter ginsengisoli TaxID=363852 RepID=A0A2D1U856_9SPHI|nr:Crp/Fnr family transcriptional regulator [Pedobacter ginsengisoli]ATP57788.1 Crp/Fnr family transcriptional regulator [Pedobacter ginsengisoli]